MKKWMRKQSKIFSEINIFEISCSSNILYTYLTKYYMMILKQKLETFKYLVSIQYNVGWDL